MYLGFICEVTKLCRRQGTWSTGKEMKNEEGLGERKEELNVYVHMYMSVASISSQ
jgi:hypothetical protein